MISFAAMNRALALALILPAGTISPVRAQAPGVPIEERTNPAGQEAILKQASRLLEDGKLVPSARLMEQMKKPIPESIILPSARSIPMERQALYEVARQSRLRVGWYYLCTSCQHWHTHFAGGYPLTEDGVIATCEHVVHPPAKMKEGYLIVLDAEGKVFPVTSIIAANAHRDICLLRAAAGPFRALPLNDQVRPGDAAYCLSDPLGNDGYFSEGIVNRFYRKPGKKATPDEALRLNVSTDWAPGSSGSPVLDQCGNVIGHVSTISALTGKRGEARPKDAQRDPQAARPAPPGTQIILHEASPSRGVHQMVQAAAEAARKADPDKSAGSDAGPEEPDTPAPARDGFPQGPG